MALPSAHLPAAVLRPVRGHHAFEACVEQLATAIRLGVYPRGTTLPAERDLAELLGVSRATLREAMAALRQAGLVETTRGRGGGTVVTLKPGTPSGAGRGPDLADAGARTGWTRSTTAGSSSPGRPRWPRPGRSTTYAVSSWRPRTPRWPPPTSPPRTGRRTRAST